jgi:hypothetical protein
MRGLSSAFDDIGTLPLPPQLRGGNGDGAAMQGAPGAMQAGGPESNSGFFATGLISTPTDLLGMQAPPAGAAAQHQLSALQAAQVQHERQLRALQAQQQQLVAAMHGQQQPGSEPGIYPLPENVTVQGRRFVDGRAGADRSFSRPPKLELEVSAATGGGGNNAGSPGTPSCGAAPGGGGDADAAAGSAGRLPSLHAAQQALMQAQQLANMQKHPQLNIGSFNRRMLLPPLQEQQVFSAPCGLVQWRGDDMAAGFDGRMGGFAGMDGGVSSIELPGVMRLNPSDAAGAAQIAALQNQMAAQAQQLQQLQMMSGPLPTLFAPANSGGAPAQAQAQQPQQPQQQPQQPQGAHAGSNPFSNLFQGLRAKTAALLGKPTLPAAPQQQAGSQTGSGSTSSQPSVNTAAAESAAASRAAAGKHGEDSSDAARARARHKARGAAAAAALTVPTAAVPLAAARPDQAEQQKRRMLVFRRMKSDSANVPAKLNFSSQRMISSALEKQQGHRLAAPDAAASAPLPAPVPPTLQPPAAAAAGARGGARRARSSGDDVCDGDQLPGGSSGSLTGGGGRRSGGLSGEKRSGADCLDVAGRAHSFEDSSKKLHSAFLDFMSGAPAGAGGGATSPLPRGSLDGGGGGGQPMLLPTATSGQLLPSIPEGVCSASNLMFAQMRQAALLAQFGPGGAGPAASFSGGAPSSAAYFSAPSNLMWIGGGGGDGAMQQQQMMQGQPFAPQQWNSAGSCVLQQEQGGGGGGFGEGATEGGFALPNQQMAGQQQWHSAGSCGLPGFGGAQQLPLGAAGDGGWALAGGRAGSAPAPQQQFGGGLQQLPPQAVWQSAGSNVGPDLMGFMPAAAADGGSFVGMTLEQQQQQQLQLLGQQQLQLQQMQMQMQFGA